MSPANGTDALTPPIDTTGTVVSVPLWTDDPAITGVDTAPNPLAYNTTVSPGEAGVVRPGNSVGGPMSDPFTCVPITYGPPLKTKNAIDVDCDCTTNVELLAVPTFTTTCAGTGARSGGVSTLSCVALM